MVRDHAAPREIVDRLRRLRVDDALVVGVGEPLVCALGKEVPGLRAFPAMAGPGGGVPSTQAALFLHTRADDHGDSLRAMRRAARGSWLVARPGGGASCARCSRMRHG